ncbi:uncharacterized protein C2845_PM14G05740 [Panicum miliaceum]|uniref:Uncharacterized protein n=1 Tax=Panicum miliaceum TaxID=4540 RepID=A0A3L6PU36_PANMI|nr:uncharacterized protein C2845_PM14G05740 [Panicum miliaceum]
MILKRNYPMQDFPWVPYVDLWHRKHWENLHRFSTQWFRPDPLCCKQHDQHKPHISNLEMLGLPDVPLEHVIKVNLQCQVSLSEYNKHRTMLSEYESSLQDCPQLNVVLAFTPHDSSKDMLPADKSSAIASIDGQEQNCLHTNITLKQLNETMLTKAIDYFYRNTKAKVCQMLWKSKHGTEYIKFEKASMVTRRTSRGAWKRRPVQWQVQELGSRNRMVLRFLKSWVSHAPEQLQGLILDWIEKEKESQFAAPPLSLNF